MCTPLVLFVSARPRAHFRCCGFAPHSRALCRHATVGAAHRARKLARAHCGAARRFCARARLAAMCTALSTALARFPSARNCRRCSPRLAGGAARRVRALFVSTRNCQRSASRSCALCTHATVGTVCRSVCTRNCCHCAPRSRAFCPHATVGALCTALVRVHVCAERLACAHCVHARVQVCAPCRLLRVRVPACCVQHSCA